MTRTCHKQCLTKTYTRIFADLPNTQKQIQRSSQKIIIIIFFINEESLRNILDNIKCKGNNIHILGIPEGGQSKEGIENLFEEMMTKTSLMW